MHSYKHLKGNQVNVLLSDCMGIFVDDNKENMKMCSCHKCPTFKNSHLEIGLFCAKGKATKEAEDILQSGCSCWNCPVSDKYDLALEYFCVRGKSAEIP
jgi:hypothetical protein